jgi:hypothetical protein
MTHLVDRCWTGHLCSLNELWTDFYSELRAAFSRPAPRQIGSNSASELSTATTTRSELRLTLPLTGCLDFLLLDLNNKHEDPLYTLRLLGKWSRCP